MISVKANLLALWEKIDRAARSSGRRKEEITLVAVTKQVPLERIKEALACGVSQIGENRLQEAEEKLGQIPPGIKKHLVGHLQTNKAKKAIVMFDMIQSLDSLKLAEELNRRSEGKPVSVLVEVNTSGEKSKSGLNPHEVDNFLEQLTAVKNIRVKGLMTVGPLTDSEVKIANSFRMLKKLFDQAKSANLPNCRMEYLSMGMSGDFEIAIQEGSNMLRIGNAIFGARN